MDQNAKITRDAQDLVWRYVKEGTKLMIASFVGFMAAGLIFYGIVTTAVQSNSEAHVGFESADNKHRAEIMALQVLVADVNGKLTVIINNQEDQNKNITGIYKILASKNK